MTDKTASTKLRDGYTLDIRKIFLTTLVLGVLGILLPQTFGFNALSVIIPLALMAAYAGIGYRRSKDSPFLEQFADSVYYLGFLFTLIALVVSLYFYRGGSIEVESIIANFSLALITTIFGLAVRITINNFEIDIRGAERQMLEGVEQAANDFVRKAKTLSMQLELSYDETQRSLQQAMEDAALGIGRATGVIEKHARMCSQALREQVETVNLSVSDTVKTLERTINNVEFPEDVFVRKIDAPLEALLEHLNETRKVVIDLTQEQIATKTGYREMTREIDKINGVLTATGRSLAEFNGAIEGHTQSCAEFEHLVGRIGQLSETVGKATEALAVQSERSLSAVDRFSGLLDSIERLPAETEAFADRLRKVSDQVVEVFDAIGHHTQDGRQIGDDLARIAEALMKTQLTVKQISDFGMHVTSAFKRLESFNQAIELHTRNLEAMGNLANTDIELAQKHQQEMAAILESSRTSMAMLNRHFVDSVEYLNDRLRD
ncbi:MAG: hypothetical protein ACU83N_11105 [Gammaproteobacteria bacterium]